MDSVLELVERSNQRGGRMLSVIDLLEAGTLTPRQTAWLLNRIEGGASWMVGALPGGAGKTAIMSALLAMLPGNQVVHLATPGSGWEKSRQCDCVVAYEISPAPYESYIWGEELQRFALLGHSGCRLVTNLHADTLQAAYAQIVNENSVSPEHFAAFGIFLPITLSGEASSRRRIVRTMHYVEEGQWREWAAEPEPSEREKEILRFLEDCRAKRLLTVGEVRKAWLEWLGVHHR